MLASKKEDVLGLDALAMISYIPNIFDIGCCCDEKAHWKNRCGVPKSLLPKPPARGDGGRRDDIEKIAYLLRRGSPTNKLRNAKTWNEDLP